MKKTIKVGLIGLVGVVTATLIIAAYFLVPFVLNIRDFAADQEAGYQAPFYLYVSPRAKQLAMNGEPVPRQNKLDILRVLHKRVFSGSS